MSTSAPSTTRAVIAGLLAWLIPGAGHYYLGHRGLARVFFGAITFAFVVGLAIGGVKTSINPFYNRWLFLAELGTGGYTAVGLGLSNVVGGVDTRMTAAVIRREPAFTGLPFDQQRKIEEKLLPYLSFYPAADVAQIYLAIAGLLNLLAILDALMRAQTGGRPVFYPELTAQGQEGGADA